MKLVSGPTWATIDIQCGECGTVVNINRQDVIRCHGGSSEHVTGLYCPTCQKTIPVGPINRRLLGCDERLCNETT